MNRLIVVALLVVFSFGSYAGFDAGGGGGKIAIALRNKTVHHEVLDSVEDHSSLGVEHFREVVVIDSAKKELAIDVQQIGIANPSGTGVGGEPIVDPVLQFRSMAKEGDVIVLIIDFKSYKMTDGKLVLDLDDDWGTSLKVFQILQGGEIIEQDAEGAWELKNWNELETNFSIHLFLDPVLPSQV